MSSLPDSSLNRLLRGISTSDVQTVRHAWREMLSFQERAVPGVRRKLASAAWREKPRGPSDRYFGTLLALLHELEPETFKKEVQRLRAEPIHPLHKRTLELMARRRGDKLFGKINSLVPVYISDEVDRPDVVFKYLENWSQTRDLAFSDVTRVDVIASRPELDFLGLYNLFYDGIVLVWQNDASNNFLSFFQKMRTERTFYHEIGHHYYQHSEGGQVEEQEKEANNYMQRMFRNAHPILFAFAKIIFSPVFFALRLSKKWTKN